MPYPDLFRLPLEVGKLMSALLLITKGCAWKWGAAKGDEIEIKKKKKQEISLL